MGRGWRGGRASKHNLAGSCLGVFFSPSFHPSCSFYLLLSLVLILINSTSFFPELYEFEGQNFDRSNLNKTWMKESLFFLFFFFRVLRFLLLFSRCLATL